MAKNSYVKELKVVVDSKELDVLQKKIDTLYIDTINSSLAEFSKETSKQDLDEIKKLRGMIAELSNSAQQDPSFSVMKLVKDKLGSVLSSLADSMKDFFSDMFADAKERILDMATYDLGSSFITNQSARSQALQYGITDPSQNYALSQTMSELGMSSQEDLMYMNPTQKDKFAERMGYWSGKYTELANKDMFNTIQEFTLEWSEFKSEMQLDMIQFFVENKDVIKAAMKGLLVFMDVSLGILGNILDFLQISRSEEQRTAAAMEIVRTYGGNIKTTNVNINNTLNPSSQVLTDKDMLSKAGTLSYTQLIEALKQ